MSLRTIEGITAKIVTGILRLLQFVLALTVIGLYGHYVSLASKAHESQDGRWVYAVVVGALSALTAIIYMLPFIALRLFFIWDIILFILWMVVFAIFGKLFIHEHAEGNADIGRMKSAVWVDLICWMLWLISACVGGFLFWQYKRGKTTLTGRAREHV